MSPDAIRKILGLAILLSVAIATPWNSALAADPAGLSGAIKDQRGRLLDGVEVLVVPASASVRPLATALSDAAGRFVVPELAPGIYRVAALKSGYTTWIGVVNTSLERWVDVVLRPGEASLDDSVRPKDSSWALRLPRRNVFRDTGAGVDSVARAFDAAIGSQPVAERPLSLQFDHLRAVSGLSGAGQSASEVNGSDTSLKVTTALGDRGNLSVAGRRQSLDSPFDESSDVGASHVDASEFNVDFSYETGIQERVEVSAWYGLRDSALGAAPGLGAASLGQAQRSWGYRSRWQKQIDKNSSVAVSMLYDDRSLDLQRAIAPLASTSIAPEITNYGRFANRSVKLAGQYETVVGDDHLVGAGFSVRRLETPMEFDLGAKQASWTLQADAQDTWKLSTPISLIYGLGYQQAIGETGESGTGVVAPRVGGSWSLQEVTLRLTVSYHAVTYWNNDAEPQLARGSSAAENSRSTATLEAPEADYGYAGEVEFRLPRGFRLIGSSSWSPLQLAAVDAVHGADVVDLPLYVSEGPAAIGEARVTLRHESGSTHLYVEMATGQIDGVLAPLQPYALVAESFEPGSLQYTNGRWGVRVIPSGTDVQVEYRQVDGFGTEAGVPVAEQKTLELKLTQDLMRFSELGNWRLLMAIRMGSVDFDDADARVEETIAAGTLGGGVSAGLSVSF